MPVPTNTRRADVPNVRMCLTVRRVLVGTGGTCFQLGPAVACGPGTDSPSYMQAGCARGCSPGVGLALRCGSAAQWRCTAAPPALHLQCRRGACMAALAVQGGS